MGWGWWREAGGRGEVGESKQEQVASTGAATRQTERKDRGHMSTLGLRQLSGVPSFPRSRAQRPPPVLP